MGLSSLKSTIVKNRILITLIAIIVLGSFLRLYQLGEKSLWQDEALFWQWADALSLDDFLQRKHYSTNVYIIVLSAINSIDTDENILRLFSAFSGILSIPAFYFLACRFTKKEGALAGSLFLALARNQVSQSQQLREYSLTVLLTVLIVLFFLRFINNKKPFDLILFTVVSVIGIYAQVGLLLILAALACSSLILIWVHPEYDRKVILLGLGVYAVAIVVAGLFLWRFAYSQYLGFAAGSYLSVGYWDKNLASLLPFIWNNSSLTLTYAFNSKTDLFAMFFVIWGAVYWMLNFHKKELVLSLVFFPIAIAIIAGLIQIYPFAGSRHTIFLSIPIYILAGVGLNELFEYRRWLFGIAVALFGFYLFQSSFIVVTAEGHEELRSITQTLCKEANINDNIYIQSEAIPAFNYYWRKCHLSRDDSRWRFNPEQLNIAPFFTGEGLEASNLSDGNLWLVASHLNEGELNQFLHNAAQSLGQRPAIFDEAPGAWLFWLKSDQIK